LFKRDPVNNYIEEAANDCANCAGERAYDWQRHIKGAIYRRDDHPISLYRGCDPLPTHFLLQRS
jgi:acetyl-CoA carboxylase alpha subunit